MLEIYTFFSIIVIFIFIGFNIKLFLSYKFWPFIFYLFYAYILPILSNLYLEQGIYITEQERYSYFTGSTLRLLSYTFVFFIIYYFAINIISSIAYNKKILHDNTLDTKSKKNFFFLFYIVIILLLLMYINLLLSEIPLFSSDITRFNYWENSRFPFLVGIVGNISLPIPIILGIYYMHFSNNNSHSWKTKIIILFSIYIIYLYLIGQKFSAQFLAVYFFFLPYWVTNIKDISSSIFSYRSLKYTIPILLLLFGFIVYKYQFTGISELKGSALSGIVYRIFGLQGHMYWGIDEMVFKRNLYGWNYFQEFINNDFNGLLLEMKLIGPSNLDWYLENNIQFTAGYPGILLLFNPFLAILIQGIFAFIFSMLVLYTYSMLIKSNIIRSFFAIMVIFQFQYGLGMGNFQFLYGMKFIIPILGIVLIELLEVLLNRNRLLK